MCKCMLDNVNTQQNTKKSNQICSVRHSSIALLSNEIGNTLLCFQKQLCLPFKKRFKKEHFSKVFLCYLLLWNFDSNTLAKKGEIGFLKIHFLKMKAFTRSGICLEFYPSNFVMMLDSCKHTKCCPWRRKNHREHREIKHRRQKCTIAKHAIVFDKNKKAWKTKYTHSKISKRNY